MNVVQVMNKRKSNYKVHEYRKNEEDTRNESFARRQGFNIKA